MWNSLGYFFHVVYISLDYIMAEVTRVNLFLGQNCKWTLLFVSCESLHFLLFFVNATEKNAFAKWMVTYHMHETLLVVSWKHTMFSTALWSQVFIDYSNSSSWSSLPWDWSRTLNEYMMRTITKASLKIVALVPQAWGPIGHSDDPCFQVLYPLISNVQWSLIYLNSVFTPICRHLNKWL